MFSSVYGQNPAMQKALSGMGTEPKPKPKSSGLWSSFGNAMSDPNVQSLMAGVGKRLDPEGMGAALGEPTQEMIQSKAMAEAHEKQSQQMKQLIDALGGRPGSVKVGRDGEISVDVKEGGKPEGEKPESALKTDADDPLKSMATQLQSFFEKMFGNN